MEALAPWAQPVLLMAEDLSRLPDDGWHHELVEGRLVRVSPTANRHGRIAMALLLAVGPGPAMVERGSALGLDRVV